MILARLCGHKPGPPAEVGGCSVTASGCEVTQETTDAQY